MIANHRRTRASHGRPWVTVALLGLLFVLSFADRTLLALLVGPLTRDLGITPVSLGALFGFGFVLVYSVAGIPLAHWLDRRPRKLVVFLGVMTWGMATIGSGFARNTTDLFILRAGLAFGEAVLTPAAISLIADLFPPDRRSAPTATYMTLGAVGATGGVMLGGAALALGSYLEPATGIAPWRSTFLLMGVPTLVTGFVFLAVVGEPARHAREGAAADFSLAACLRWLVAQRGSFFGMFLAVGFLLLILQGAQPWQIRMLELEHGIPPATSSLLVGSTSVVAALLGSFGFPWLARRWGRGRRSAIYVLGLSVLATIPFLLALHASTAVLIVALALATTGQTGAIATVAVAIQNHAPATMHARVSAIFLLTINFLGLGAGPMAMGYVLQSGGSSMPISDAIRHVGPLAVLLAMLCVLGALVSARRKLDHAD